MGVYKFQLFGYTSYTICYNCANFIVLASLSSELAGGRVKKHLRPLRVKDKMGGWGMGGWGMREWGDGGMGDGGCCFLLVV